MNDVALFMNGVYDNVLGDILKIQVHLPDQILYLQPHSGQRIALLADVRPSIYDPVRLFASTTVDLATVHYVGDIVGWSDKRYLSEAQQHVLDRIIYALQPTEGGVYGRVGADTWECVNLLYVRRLRKLSHPFSVAKLHNVRTNRPLSTERTTAGGWNYVRDPGTAWLAPYW